MERAKGRLARAEEFLRRLERAQELVRAGKVFPVPGLKGRYVVVGSQDYLVNLEAESCTCPDWERGQVCKHLLGAWLVERRGEKGEEKREVVL